jgi:hypothetical protein
MTKHIITKDYDQLRGFSTDSIFKRPAYVADEVVNMQRLPDGTFAPRRGYQAQTANIGGLGASVYENKIDQETQDVCIHSDGNMYKKRTGSMTISFAGSSSSEYVTYEIYVDESLASDTADCDFDPYAVVAEAALVTDSINFRMKKLSAFTGVSIGTGFGSYAGILPGFPLTPGTIVMTDGTLTIQDDANGGFTGDVGAGINSINYTTGAYTVNFSAITGAVTASYRSTLQTQFNQLMGKGFGVASPYLISTLVTQIASISGVTVTTTGQTNKPAAFIEIEEETNIADGKSVTLTWFYWESVNRTVPVVFAGLLAMLDTDEFQNATFAAYQEVIYIADPYDDVQKYDGQTIYKAGMPTGVIPQVVVTNVGTGTVTPGAHTYYITYQQIDATGRLVEGVLSLPASLVVGTDDVLVTYANLLQGSGWNTNGAIINGVQLNVNTIQVLPGHTMQPGDTAFFIDVADVTHKPLILSVTANSITIDGAPVSVSDAIAWKKAISNDLTVNIWRTKVGGTIPNLLISVPNNSYAITTTYVDQATDASLSVEYVTPPRRSDPPPRTGIVFSFRNQLIFGRDPVNDDYVWFSEPDQPEYVSSEILKGNNFIVPSNDDDVSGIGASGSTLVIFKEKSIYSINGELATSQFTVTPIHPGSNIGSVNHGSIASVGGLLYFLSGVNGVYALAENTIFPTDKFGNPVPLSLMIDQVFRITPVQKNKRFALKRSTAVNYAKDNQYLLFLPCEEEEGARFANDNSQVLCYDYQGKNWFPWTRINAAGNFYVRQDNLFWQERRAASTTSGITSNTYNQHRKYRLIDQVDHVTSIRVTWLSSWEDLGQPRVRKKFVRAALLFDNISTIYQLNRPNLCFSSYVDWNKGILSTRSDVTTQIQSRKWNLAPWDWTQWSGYQDTFITIPMKSGTVSKSMQVGLQLNQLNTSFSLQGFQLEIAPDFRREILR